MSLCFNCENFLEGSDSVKCFKGHWVSSDITRARTYNPIMFECIDFESVSCSDRFGGDTFFDVMSIMTK